MVVSVELRLRCWPDGCGDTKESTGCQAGLRQAWTWVMPAWAMSAGEVLREELAAAACFFCCLLLLLLQVVRLLHEGIHTRCRVHASVSPARGNVVSKGKEPRSLVYAPLGRTRNLANPKRPESFRPTGSSCRISYRPYLALP